MALSLIKRATRRSPDGFAVALQIGMDTRAAVSLSAFVVHLANAFKQPRIVVRAYARTTIAPGVVATRTDTVQPAKQPHRMMLLLVDEGEDVGFRAEVNAIAFFKRSCSIFNCS